MVKIPVAIPDLTGNEEKYVVEAIKSSWISSDGAFVHRFEKEFSKICETKYAISVCNGTAALHLCLLALDVKKGDEVLLPSLTYVATANAVRYCGAEPIFVDIDPDTWCIDPNLIESKITNRTKGIIAVHLYGHPAEMDMINGIAEKFGLWVIEDAAQAHFAKYKGRPIGGISKMAAFSFYGNKIITSGEGGAITVNDPKLESRIRTFRGQGVDPLRRYYFPVTGYNYRLSNIACAILCAQLERYEEILEKRRRIFFLYKKYLRAIPGISFQIVKDNVTPVPWLFCIIINEEKFGKTREDVMNHLSNSGVDTRPFFIPLHLLPPFSKQSKERGENLPVSEKIGLNGINLPTYNHLSNDEIKEITDLIKFLHS